MIKVMVIEDRILTLNALKTQVQWEKYGLTPVGFYTNCKDALENIRGKAPDVIISDIVMPGMDGLSFCEYVNNLNQNIKIIIISAYSKFEYAKRGIQLGVYDFLEKPVDYELLCQRVCEAGREKLREEELKKKLTNNQAIYTESLFMNIIRDHRDVIKQDIEEQLESVIKINLKERQFNCIMIAVEFAEENMTMKEICSFMKEQIQKEYGGECWGPYLYQGNIYCLIMAREKEHKVEIPERILRKSMDKVLADSSSMHINIGIGYWSEGIYDIYKSAKAAQKALEYRFVFGKNDIFNISDYKDKKLEDYTGFEQFGKQLAACIECGDVDGIKKICGSIALYIEKHQINKSYLDYFITDFFGVHIESLSADPDFDKDDCLLNLRKFLYVSESLDYFAGVLISASRVKKPVTDTENTVIRIKEYIGENYKTDNLSLGEISKIFNMSPNYICRIFKEKTGNTLLNYINNLKMLEAKRLLSQTDKKIWEISQELGYSNQYYFSMGFKKATGYSPKEYRKMS